jgi:PPOX class probable F420-dependent enzyme
MLDPAIQALATEPNFGTISFRLPDGHIASHVMWVDATDAHVLINTEVHRAKYRAIQVDPVVTVTVWDRDDPYRYAEVRGRVTGEIRGDEARAHIDACSRRYQGRDYATEIQSERVILQITPERQRTNGL